ncbi:MAG: C4-dicarboxylic acid transporter DauA [Polyangiaceae bacterium]|nr:C4-dicarboxylic acid transporter DauA [Myxococcales bacterium]MCB9587681.1 C4-dicarboxylic acid transporter DauA [Polyangiaceae bacterium]MCB9605521.1 C4-dicarboxylic acid transporter DauA [Polyangiaceae bacterium]
MARTRYVGSEEGLALQHLPASALRAVLREGYGWRALRADVLAGVVVGIVALPLAMALAIGVGVPPQQGLATAVVAGIVVALLGGSRTQVTGPTAAFIVVLSPIYARFGLAGLLVSGLLAGFILVGLGLLRLGRLIEFVPYPVTTGFTAGIAVVIAVLQLKDVFGLTLTRTPPDFLERVAVMFEARHTASLWEVGVAGLTLVLLLGVPRLTRRFPAPLVALPVASLAAAASKRWGGVEIATIATRFHTEIDQKLVHGIPQLPPLPMLPWRATSPGANNVDFSHETLRALISGALAIAMLGAIESLLSAVVADGMARTKHDPDSELIAQGVGNIIAPFFGGIPATGAIARTATNIRGGARSPIAAVVHSLTVLSAVLVLAPLLGYLPMAALAALLLTVAWNMSEARHFVHMLRIAPKSDVAVLLTCFSLTVCFDMVVGVSVGMLLASLLFMRRMAEVTRVGQTELRDSAPKAVLPEGCVTYEISGPLFFGAAQKAMAALTVVDPGTRWVILDVQQVNAIDATGLVALESALQELHASGCSVRLAGVQAQPLTALRKAKLEETAGVEIFPDLDAAVSTLPLGAVLNRP